MIWSWSISAAPAESNPLRCPDPDPDDLEAQLSTDVDVERLTACLSSLDADPTQYGTAAAVDDLDAVRGALGRERVDLVGGSYGTRVALVYMRRHPERVRAVVLDGAVPVDMELPLGFARDGQRAFDRLAEDCASEPACDAAFGDVHASLRRVLGSLPGSPVVVDHPRTGAPVELELEPGALAAGIRGMLYTPAVASLLPLSLQQAEAGEYGPLVAQSLLFSDGVRSGFAEGLFLSVLCSEDVPFITEAEIDAETKDTFVGDHIVRALQASCRIWPRAELSPGARAPVTSAVPTLVLSGALDPAAAPRWGQAVADRLEHARHVVVPGAGHGTLGRDCVGDRGRVRRRRRPRSGRSGLRRGPAPPPVLRRLRRAGGGGPVIVAHDLHKRFGDVVAVDGVSLRAEDGRITGLLGPNGAGKTTTLRMICTLVRPDGGRAEVDGLDGAAEPTRCGGGSACSRMRGGCTPPHRP